MGPMQGVQPKAKAKPSKKPLHAVGCAAELRRWTSRLSQRDKAGPKKPMTESEKKDRKSTRLNSSHGYISYAVFCLKKKKKNTERSTQYPITPHADPCL